MSVRACAPLLAEDSFERPRFGIECCDTVPNRGDISWAHLLRVEVSAASFQAGSAPFEYSGKGPT
ncbi:hypothetical protein BKG75_16215 [Mycobacteroides chelonae]|nr:hypothetical protein DYE20_04590 [[Mycobacterium] chelonae subsp. gwanakae]OHU16501.1 hypothetical protein BKG75_16215 [Mycobacteroides chelonae]